MDKLTVTTRDDDNERGGITETWMTAADDISSSSDGSEFDVDVYLEQHLGRRHHSVVESASLTAVYLLILLTGALLTTQPSPAQPSPAELSRMSRLQDLAY